MTYNSLQFKQKTELTLVMPVLNDGVRIIPTITTLAYTIKTPFTILVIYDKDDDTTLQVIHDLQGTFSNIRLIKNEGKKLVGAIKTGFKMNESEFVGIWLAYHVDPFGLLNDMLDLARRGCSLVSGNRFNKIKRISRGDIIKKILSRGGNFILNRVIGLPLGDITTSIKLYHKTFIEETEIETLISGGWAINTELTVKAAIKGCKLGDVEFRPENTNIINGISNFKVFKQLDQYLYWLGVGFKNRKLIKINYQNGKNFYK